MRARFSLLGAFVGVILACLGALPAGALAAPNIERQWVSGVTSSDATLNAEIDPGGLLTKYMLQIDTTGNFKFDQNDSCVLHPPGILCAQVLIGGDPLAPGLVPPVEMTLPLASGSQVVSSRMANIGAVLQPSTTYHFRAVAANSHGFTYGPDLTFTTPPTTAPPTIGEQWVTDVTDDDATLHALINPNGLLTKYELQIDTTGNFNFFQTSSCPLNVPGVLCAAVMVPGDPLAPGLVQPPEFSLPAGYGSQHVSVNMASIGATLQPGTTYYYRALAANGLPFVEGAMQTFVTPSSIEDPPPEEPPDEGSLPPDEGVSRASNDEEKEKEGGQRAVVPAPPLGIAPTVQGNQSKRVHRRKVRRCVRQVRKRAYRGGRRLSRRAAQRRCARSRHPGSKRRVGIASRIALSK